MINSINKILDFFTPYFEEIVLLDAFVLFMILVLFIAVKSDSFNKNRIMAVVNQFLYRLVIVGEVFLLVFTGYVYWLNYELKPIQPLAERLQYRTDWVKDDLDIFFIAGKSLVSIRANGSDRTTVFDAPEAIREYHFSPDGRYIVAVTDSQLYLINRKDRSSQLVEDIQKGGLAAGAGHVVRAVSWAPDSKKFSYQRSVWSQYATQDQFYVYDVASKQKITLKTLGRQVPFLFWDKKSDALYFFQHQAQDTSLVKSQFWVRLFKIPLATGEPVLVRQRPSNTYDLDMTYFTSLGADIFYEGFRLSYDRVEGDSFWTSPEGTHLGVDKEDYLYYVRWYFWPKRLFKIPRDQLKGSIPRYQYKANPIALHHVRWLPGARYVIMEHGLLGILILEPSTGRVGQLTYAPGHTFGWYRPLNRSDSDFASAVERLNLKSVGGK